MTAVIRSDGLTASERYLKRLCDRSFLTLWSYPNLHLDKADGQELCDLLVVFGRHVVIFSDKSCQYPSTGKPELDWARWFRRSITKSADQVFGAERWIRKHPDRIFLDPACKQRFPLALPSKDDVIFHRVVVALGAAQRSRDFHGGSGSLMNTPLGQRSTIGDSLPFAVGDISPERGYVHVLDDVTLEVVLGELDTVADFTAYLGAKERLVRSGLLLSAAGEEDLLAYYLRCLGPDSHHEFRVPEETAIIIDEGFWRDLQSTPEYLGKKEADEVSYRWDDLIKAFSKNIAAGTLATGNELGIQAHEQTMRLMAGEPRIARRMLGSAMMETIRATPKHGQSIRIMGTRQRPNVGYVFMLDAQEPGENYDNYRKRRTAKLEAYCRVSKLKRPEFVQIVGVAMEPLGSQGSSEDLLYLDTSTWTPEDDQLARDLHEKGLLKNVRQREATFHEYPKRRGPAQHDQSSIRRARNKRKKRRQRGAG